MGYYYGKTVELAIEEGLNDLGITKENAKIVVEEEPTKGVLGIGLKKAKVLVEEKISDSKKAVNFLDGLFKIMNIPCQEEVKEEDDVIKINLIATSSSSLIGHRGEVLDAIEVLTGAAANIGNEEYKRVVVDCENYREKREETLKDLAVKLANKAIKYQRKVNLEPMNSKERRIIHSALADMEHITTESQGVEPNRYIVIIPDNVKPFDRKDNRKDRGARKSGFSSDMIKTTKKTSGFGTYLGNSFKNN